jgi:LysR family transcriptional regulator, glycine cleavage system transcriptional activator
MTWNSQTAGGAGQPMPSLNALWTFDTVARHGNMTRAAAELNVTQTAVSHQIRRLEEELGYALFRRVGNRSEVTEQGAVWAEQLTPLFARLRSINQQFRHKGPVTQQTLSISIIPSLATRFLVPRMGEFLARYPDLRVQVEATERVVDLDLEKVDVAIRYGRGKYPGFHVTKLMGDGFIPVCTPVYMKKHRLTKPQTLGTVDLLRDDYPDVWGRWLELAGAKHLVPKRTIEYTESAMLVQAALLGQGVALSRRSLVSDELRDGRLVRLFPNVAPLPCELSYFVLVSEFAQGRQLVTTFVRWLEREVSLAGLTG